MNDYRVSHILDRLIEKGLEGELLDLKVNGSPGTLVGTYRSNEFSIEEDFERSIRLKFQRYDNGDHRLVDALSEIMGYGPSLSLSPNKDLYVFEWDSNANPVDNSAQTVS